MHPTCTTARSQTRVCIPYLCRSLSRACARETLPPARDDSLAGVRLSVNSSVVLGGLFISPHRPNPKWPGVVWVLLSVWACTTKQPRFPRSAVTPLWDRYTWRQGTDVDADVSWVIYRWLLAARIQGTWYFKPRLDNGCVHALSWRSTVVVVGCLGVACFITP